VSAFSVRSSVSVRRRSFPPEMRPPNIPFDPSADVPSNFPVRRSQRSTYAGPSVWLSGFPSANAM
jgi:hypothetical protein